MATPNDFSSIVSEIYQGMVDKGYTGTEADLAVALSALSDDNGATTKWIDLGASSAYAIAVEHGYTGTEEEWIALLMNITQNAQIAKDSADSAAESAASAKQSEEAIPTKKEEALQAIASAESDALQSVNTAGTTQTGNVNTAGQTQVQAVNAAGTTQVGLVEQEGSDQKDVVIAEGEKQTQRVSNQGILEVQAVAGEGTRQTGLVTSEGTTQVARVTAEGTTQVGNVTTEGTTQIAAVQAKGDEVIESIPQDYSALVADVSDLKSEVEETVISTTTEKWYSGSTAENYTSSSFSGFATSWANEHEISATGITFTVRSRSASGNIKKIKIRIESNDSSFVFEKLYDVDIGSTATEVTLPISGKIPAGLIWVAICADRASTFLQESTGGKSYKYWTSGDLSTIDDLKESGGSSYSLAIKIAYINGIKIQDNSIDQKKLSFASYQIPENHFNVDDINQYKKGYWWVSHGIGNEVELQDVSAYDYTAIKVDTYGLSQFTIGCYPVPANKPNVYWIGSADEDMILLSRESINTQTPVTYTVADGAKYLLITLASKSNAVLDALMVVNGTEITHYVNGEKVKYLLEDCTVEDAQKSAYEAVKIKSPESYNLVVGDTFQLFKKGLVSASNTDIFDIVFTCTKGNAFTDMYEITPTTAETLTLTIDLYDPGHNLIDSKNVSLIVSAKATSPQSTKYVLCVGDSLTTGGEWPKELYRRLTGVDGTPDGDGLTNIQFIGTRQADGVKFEGYGGWTFTSYNTENVNQNSKIITCLHDKTQDDQHSIYRASNNATWKLETIENGQIKIMAVSGDGGGFSSTGTLTWVSGGVNHADIVYTASANAPGNPFWDGEKVNFSWYASNQGVNSIDYVYVLIGWNSAGSSESGYKTAAQTFIDNVHASFPNAKVVLMGLEIPARDGLGVNYGATGTYANYYKLMQHVYNLDAWYADLADTNSNVYSVSVAGQFDTIHNMQTGTRAVNTRNSATEIYQTNGIHPANSGYMQIADAAYRHITWLL